MDQTTLLILGVVFLISLVRSTFGFADALVGMPLITLLAGLQVATPLIALIAVTLSFVILLKNVRKVNIKALWKLVLSSVIGIPFGLWLLKLPYDNLMKGILGSIIFLFALYKLASPMIGHFKNDRYSFLFGWLAGVLGGAYNAVGPAIVIYGVMRRWKPDRFRATLQGYFLPVGILLVISHALAGFWTIQVLTYYAWSIPIVLVAVWFGKFINRRISVERFSIYIYVLLLVLGGMLVIKSIVLNI